MLLMKYNNKLIYTNFSRKDLKGMRVNLTSNVNKVEVIMNNIGGFELEHEIETISTLYGMIEKYYMGKVRIILYTMNNNLHKIVKYELNKYGMHEDDILKMYGGSYLFIDHNTGNHHRFYKKDHNLYHSIIMPCHTQCSVFFSEKFFGRKYTVMYRVDNRIDKENPLLWDIIMKERINYYPITKYDDITNATKCIYSKYKEARMDEIRKG